MSRIRIPAAALAATVALAGATAPGLAQAKPSHYSVNKCERQLGLFQKAHKKQFKKNPAAAAKAQAKLIRRLQKHGCKFGG